MSIDPTYSGVDTPTGPPPIPLTPGVQGDLRAASDSTAPKDEGEFSFWDFIDIINPLQHIPVVSTIYRELTGDTINNVARIAGDALYGGPLGLLTGFVDSAISESSGKDIGEHLLAMMDADGNVPEGVAVAAANVTTAAEPARALTEQSPPPVPAETARNAADALPEEVAVSPPSPVAAPGSPAERRIAALGPETRWFPVPERGHVSVQAPAPADAVRASHSVTRPAHAVPPIKTATPDAAMANAALSPALMAQQASPVGEALVRTVPPPEMIRQAMAAQGLQPTGTNPVLPSNGPIEVPAWFDGAMQKAMNAYEKTGRLSTGSGSPDTRAGSY